MSEQRLEPRFKLAEMLDRVEGELSDARTEAAGWHGAFDGLVARARELESELAQSLAREQRLVAALEKIVDEFTNGLTANMEYVRKTAEDALK